MSVCSRDRRAWDVTCDARKLNEVDECLLRKEPDIDANDSKKDRNRKSGESRKVCRRDYDFLGQVLCCG